MLRRYMQRTEIAETMFKELQCAKCKFRGRPPLMQCLMGHMICRNCNDAEDFCAVCEYKTRTVRNLSVEELAKCVPHPCRYNIYLIFVGYSSFPIENGLKQVDALSPLLFNFAL